MKRALMLSMLFGVIVGLVLAVLTHSPVMAGLAGAVAPFAMFLLAPPLAREAWMAEENGGILLLLHGDDQRIHPVATYYYGSGNVLRAYNKRYSNVFVKPDPESTVPVIGQKSKVALAYVNYPSTINLDHIILAYDLRRYGFRNIGQLIDLEDSEWDVERLRKHRETIAGILEALHRAGSVEDVDPGVWNALGVTPPESVEELEEIRDGLKRYLSDLDDAIRVAESERKPLFRVGGRFYTVRDVIGFLGVRTRLSDLASIVESARLEERIRLRGSFGEIAKYVVLIIGIMGMIVVAALALKGGGQPPNVIETVKNATSAVSGGAP